MLKLNRKNKIKNLKKYDFLPLFYCSATLNWVQTSEIKTFENCKSQQIER